MRLTIITTVLALGALTACNPLEQPPRFSPITVDVSESGECPGEGCPTPPPPAPTVPCSPEGGNVCFDEGGTPTPTTTAAPPIPTVCVPGESEGGLPC